MATIQLPGEKRGLELIASLPEKLKTVIEAKGRELERAYIQDNAVRMGSVFDTGLWEMRNGKVEHARWKFERNEEEVCYVDVYDIVDGVVKKIDEYLI